MKPSLKPGIRYEHRFLVPASKTVPALYPEAEEFLVMPEVFATGFLVGLLEWTCIKAVNRHLDWPLEQTVGTHIAISHSAATPAAWKSLQALSCCPSREGSWCSASARATAWMSSPRAVTSGTLSTRRASMHGFGPSEAMPRHVGAGRTQ